MKIEGNYTFNAPRDRVWQVLLDPKIIAQCMPGCESMNEVAPDQFEAVMKVGVASVKGTYKGKVAIKDKQAPSHYVLSGQGSGGPGFMQGDVAIDLEESNGQTVLKYSTDAKIGGLIASALDIGNLDEFFDIGTWLIAIAGSLLLLLVYRLIAGRNDAHPRPTRRA